MICCWIFYVCTLSFFKDLGFVLAGSWVAVQFDRFIVWFLRYFREECLYSRNSLTLFLRPGPFLVSFPNDSRYQWGLSTLGTWSIPNLSMISGKCSSTIFPSCSFPDLMEFYPYAWIWRQQRLKAPLCKFLKLFFCKDPSSQGLSLITSESLDSDLYLLNFATPLGYAWYPLLSPLSKICLQAKILVDYKPYLTFLLFYRRALHCLLSNIWKQFLNIFCSFSNCFRQ